MATGAERARRDLADPGGLCLARQEGAKVNLSRRARLGPGELSEHIRTHLVAVATDRGTEVHPDVPGRQSVRLKDSKCVGKDARRRAAPPSVDEADGTCWVGQEYRDTVRDSHAEADARL